MLGIALSVAMHATSAMALPEPKVTITYSLKVTDGGAYFRKISATPLAIGDVDFVLDVVNSGDPKVNVTRANPLVVTIEYTADSPGGNIVDGPVELTQTDFGRDFVLTTAFTVVTTLIDTVLSQIGTGTLSGSTITWDNVISPYKETVVGSSDCVGDPGFCDLLDGPWPKDLDATDRAVDLPTFTVGTNTIFGDEFVSDNGTPGDPSDDINRPNPNAIVRDTWNGVITTPSSDADGDGIPDGIDNCPFVSNNSQTNSDPLPAGDACQCGDVNGDFIVDGLDVQIAREKLMGVPLSGSFDVARCDFTGAAGSVCGVDDIFVLDRLVNGAPVTLENNCPAYLGP